MKKTLGVFPGSFDPITVGHIDIARRASKLFDTLYVVVSNNAEKKYLFDLGTRCRLAKEALKDIENVVVMSSDVMTAEFYNVVKADALVKGARTAKDFEDERNQADINYALGRAETVLLVSRPQFSFVSSSLVRQMIQFGKPIDEFVSPYIIDEINKLTKK